MTVSNQPNKYRCEVRIPASVYIDAIPLGCDDGDISMLLMETGYTQNIERALCQILKTKQDAVVVIDVANSDATKAEQRIADVKRFNPSTWNCPNSCLCPMCLDERDCEIPCEEYIKMARGCEDGCEHCKVKALLRGKEE